MGWDSTRELERLLERIEAGDRDVNEADREVLLDFSDQLYLLVSEYSDHRHLKLLRHCTKMAEETGQLAAALEDREAAEAIVRWINREYDNEETNRDYRSALRVFGKRTLRRDDPPESIAWVPTGTSNNYDPMPNESDLLRWEPDVKDMIEAARNERDAALIAVQFEAGLRSGELQSLTIGDIFRAQHTTGLHVDGKTGERAVHLITSVPHLQKWLDAHPAGDTADAPLWSKLETPEKQSYNGFMKGFKRPAKRAGIDKPVTPTNFRKSNTRWLVLQDLPQADIEDRQGRERGSDHTARYMARFGAESSERRYAAAHGMDVDEPERDLRPIECPHCGREAPAERDFCIHCAGALDHQAKQLVDDVTARIDEEVVTADDVERRRQLLSARRTIENQPTILETDEVHDVLSSLSD